MIGLEREWNNHAAGFRTHILVCVGSATIMLLSVYGFGEFAEVTNARLDPARLAAQVITGIGFLGAGAIMRREDRIAGLTTAASIWVVAAIGLCVGAGFYFVSVLATLLVLASLYLLNKWETRLLRGRNRRICEIKVKIRDHPGVLHQIAQNFEETGLQVTNLTLANGADEEERTDEEEDVLLLRFSLNRTNTDRLLSAVDRIASLRHVIAVETPILNGRRGVREPSVSRPANL